MRRTNNRSRRGTAIRALVVGMTALLLVTAGQASADEDAEALRDGLASFASSVGQLVDPAQYQDPDNLGQLADALPLSDVAPLSGLDLDDLLAQALDRSGAALDSVDAYVDALDGSTVDVGGIEIDVSATSVTAGTGRDITITLTSDPATAYRDVPLTLPTDAVDVTGGVLRLGVDLQTTLALHFEPGATDPLLGLYLTSPPTLDLDVVASTPTPVSVSANLGFTRVTIGAEVTTATAGYSLALVSPHPTGSPDAGRITAYDWTNTALEDLVEVTRSGSVDAELTLDSDLLTATSPDATLAVTDSDLSDGFSPAFGASPGVDSLRTALASSDLLDFTNVSPSQVLTGVGQIAAAIQALQTSADVPLPFLKGGVGRSLDMVAGLVAALQQQTVVCGTTETSPPTGALVGLAVGDSVFCQATTTDTVTPGSVSWTAVPGTGTVHANGTANGTVAAVPSALVEVKVVTAGVPPLVTVAYRDADNVIKGASQPAPTAQSLLTLLIDQAGFDSAGTSVAYDPASTALTFTLKRTVAGGAAEPVALDFADRFKDASGLIGLAPGSGASATVQATGAVVELTLGVLLAPQSDVPEAQPAEDADTESTFLDRFFVQAGPGGRVLSVDDLVVAANLDLKGRLGFLDVTAGGTLSVTKTANADHVLSLSLAGTGPLTAGGTTITNAVQLTKLLNALPTHVAAPVLAVSGEGALSVTAAVNNAPLATGSVDFSLGPITSVEDLIDPAKLTVTPRADFNEALKKFHDLAQDDPMALLTLILDSLTELAASTEDIAVLDTQLPLVGASPRDLLVQFQRLRLAVEELRGAPSATLTCRNTTNAGRGTITAVAGDTLGCRAENLSAATQAQWTVTGGTAVSGATETATIGPPPGSEFRFTVDTGHPGLASPENENGFHVGVAWRDGAGDHTAQLPSLGAPATLEALNDALVRKLGLPDDALQLVLVDATPPGGSGPVKTLRLKLGYGICTMGNNALPACSGTAPGTQVPKLTAPLNVDLGDLGGGGSTYGLSTQGDISLEYDANALLDVGIPLSATPTPFVFGATGASLAAGVDASGLGLTANIGPLGVQLGTAVSGGSGVLKLGGGLTVDSGAGDDTPMSFSDFADDATFALTNGGQDQDCGTGDFDNDPNTAETAIGGKACAVLSLAAVIGSPVPLGDLGLSMTDFTDLSTLDVQVDPELLQKLQDAVLSVEFLLRALPPLLDQLEVSLRSGSAGGQKLPIIGGALDAGADVVGKLNGFVTPAATGLADAVAGLDEAGEIEDAIQGHLFPLLTQPGVELLLDNDGNGTIEPDDITMDLTCGTGDCSQTAPSTSIDDIRLTFAIGQGISPDGTVAQGCTVGVDGCVASGALPFDIGLDGLPLRISGALDGSVMWRVKLDFGLSRNEGPYLGVNHKTNGQPVKDVEVGARVTLGNRADACTNEDAAYRGGVAAAAGYSDTRCLSGTLGFLNVNLRDKAADTERTGISLTAGLRLTSSSVGDNGKLKLTDILGGALGADFSVGANAQVNLLFRAGIGDLSGADIGFPAVLGTFTAGWSYTAGSGAEQGAGTPTIAFDDIYLDGGAFMSKYLQPLAQQVRSVTSPLKPVIDTLQTPIPVVSDLAALVGQPPVTLIGLAEAIGGNDLSMVKSVIAFIQFANDFPPGQTLLIPLKASNPSSPGSGVMAGDGGSFSINAASAVTPKTPNDAGSLITAPQAGSNLGGALAGRSGKPGGASTALPDGRYSTFGVPGLDIPLLREPAKVFSVLMGQDVTLVEYEFGGLRATAGFSYSFGPFMVGPVPVVITIGGGVEITGHFALGYDTSGLRQIFGGAGPEAVLNGLYLRDFDRNGQDVPEIKLAGTVYAGAAVSIAIVTAGIEAGITLTVGLDLDDRPHNDGKLNFDEIVNRLPNPICLFTVEGSLDAFLRAFVKFDFFLTSKRFDFTIVEVHLLDFSAGCSPPKPQPATPESGGILRLNIGDRASIRAVNVTQPNEKAVVRPLESGGFSVEIFGAYVEYPGSFTTIIGNGAGGNDEIVLASGVKTTGTGPNGQTCAAETPCELPWPSGTRGLLDGGDGNDNLTGGNGDDVINGQNGNDKIAGGGGTDTLKGDADSDTVDGGTGNDTIHGGTGTGASEAGDGPDNLQGGPGEDHVYGGSGDDLIAGGPGVQPGAGVAASSLDGKDHLYGGSGADSIAGHEGDDTIYGDEVLNVSCTQSGAGPAGDDVTNDDRIEGGPGVDTIVAGSGDDTVKGNVDGDILCGNGGKDTIDGDEATGPAANDTVRGGPDNDILNGHKGDDVVDGGSGNDLVRGGLGHDAVLGGTGRDRVEGGDGNDLVVGEDGTLATGVPGSLGTATAAANGAKVSAVDDSTSAGEARHDCAAAYDVTVTTSGNGDCVIGGVGDDAVLGGGGPDNLLGDDGTDWLDGGSGGDLIRGGLLDDVAYGRAGNDEIFGDSGDDDLYGGSDRDTIRGGTGVDEIEGNEGADALYGDEGDDRMIGGSSTAGTADSDDVGTGRGDVMHGLAGEDVMVGDNGTITATPAVVTLHDVTNGAVGGQDTVFGGEGDDRLYGGNADDELRGENGADTAEGNGARDLVFGGDGDDRLQGGSSPESSGSGFSQPDVGDEVHGGAGNDVILGDNGTIAPSGLTTMTDAATAATTFGDDDLFGEGGTDQVYGQQGADDLDGGGEADYLVGDLGSIGALGTPATWPGAAPNRPVALIAQSVGGVDTITGGAGDDHGYGGAAGDVLDGNAGDDYLEGNGGQDTLRGGTGEDDLIGGSSTASVPDPALDEGEVVVEGGDGVDVIAGDNADITRIVATPTTWEQDPITGGAARIVVLRYQDEPDCATGKCGGDLLKGDAHNDRVYGEGGDDTIEGGTGDDYLEGNQASDHVFGQAGEDDLLGGSSNVAGGEGLALVGRPDAGDVLSGGDGADVMAGDNAVVTRIEPFSALTDRPGMAERRNLALLDLGSSSAGTFGADTVTGDEGVDVIFGQSGDDVLKGNEGDDYAEGGQDADLVEGNGGADDLVGGSHVQLAIDGSDAETATGQPDVADQLFGGDGSDLLLGDNAQVLRSDEHGYPFSPLTARRDMTPRTLRPLDLGPSGTGTERTWPNVVAGRSGADSLSGGAGVDVALGQDGADWISGGPGDDYAEGNGNEADTQDRLYGDQLLESVTGAPATPAAVSAAAELQGPSGADGQDDLIGGSSNIDATQATAVGRDGFRDGNDVIVGNGASDFQLGDNGTLVREPDGSDDKRYVERYPIPYTVEGDVDPRAYVRHAVRLDVPAAADTAPAFSAGNDVMEGNAGDDFMWGQSGNDEMRGGDGDDDMLGELGDDVMFGDAGQDAVIGDRGGIVSRFIDGSPGDPSQQSFSQNAPPAETFVAFRSGTLDRRVHLQRDVAAHTGLSGSVDEFAATGMRSRGEDVGGVDHIRGGSDHDSLHGAAGDDLINGDSGGDYVFGSNGSDVLWGGRGCDPVADAATPDCLVGGIFDASSRGVDDRFVDHLLGGYGGLDRKNQGVPELLDFRPRGSLDTPGLTCSTSTGPSSAGGLATVDPCSWLRMTDISTGGLPQHYQGTDWLYGGYDRDVLEGNVTANGPNPGDRLMDWVGTFNLYNHCNAAYGGFNDVRQFSPGMQAFMQGWAYGLGVGSSPADVATPGTTGFSELGFVYNQNPDIQSNSGSPYSGTPGNFTDFSCAED